MGAFLFYLGSIYVDKGGVFIFTLCFVFYAVGLKRHLQINEDDLITAFKAFCCSPCTIGQLAVTTRKMRERGEIVGPPVAVLGVVPGQPAPGFAPGPPFENCAAPSAPPMPVSHNVTAAS